MSRVVAVVVILFVRLADGYEEPSANEETLADAADGKAHFDPGCKPVL